MTSAAPLSLEALPNPRGGAVREAEKALAVAKRTFEARMMLTGPLLHAAQMLHEAGWLAAQRFTDTLVLAAPFAGGDFAPQFSAALADFHAALTRRNLRELACSPTLYAHYRALNEQTARHTYTTSVAFEDLALASRPIARASLRPVDAAQLAPLRARYEAALLSLLRERETAAASAALTELDACAAELASTDRYDVWRLVGACSQSLRANGRFVSGDLDVKRFYARANLLLVEQSQGQPFAPRAFVRAALALLWRDYALYGAAAEDTEVVALLEDYGLTVVWHVAATQASEAVWEAEAEQAERAAMDGPGATRELGVLSIASAAYEDFLQTAEAAMAALAGPTTLAFADSDAALRGAAAAYRLGAAATAVGLGHVALLADALGLALKLRAHGFEAQQAGGFDRGPAASAIDPAVEALRAMLLRVAAGVAPVESVGPLSNLTQAIEGTAVSILPGPAAV
jgi:hypothetical protein